MDRAIQLGGDGSAIDDSFAPYAAESSAESEDFGVGVFAEFALRGEEGADDALFEGLVGLAAARSSRSGGG